jgi:hypothetical protein
MVYLEFHEGVPIFKTRFFNCGGVAQVVRAVES